MFFAFISIIGPQ